MNNNGIFYLLFFLFFLWIVFYSVYLNKELTNNFIFDFCIDKKRNLNISFILDARKFKIGPEHQKSNIIKYEYKMDNNFLSSFKDESFKYFKLICDIYTAHDTKHIICSSNKFKNNNFTCNFKFPKTFKIKFKEETKIKKIICHLILFIK